MIPRFRAWNKATKEMYGADDIIAINFEEKEICVQTIYFEQGLPDSRDLDYYDFDDIVLMQSTGMRDKNDREIFEGDVVTDGHTMGDIKNHSTLGFYMVDDNGIERFFSDDTTIEDFGEDVETASRILEIIGNIYTNPELAEVSS
ncbi:YopX family protein [Streptococcus salivarius]